MKANLVETFNIITDRVPAKECKGRRFNGSEQETLRRLAHSTNVKDKRRCIDYLEAASATNRSLVFELATVLVPSRSTRVRWGTLISLGSFSRTHPAELWLLVLEWGTVASADIRCGVACCILEHILEWHFADYFPRAKKAVQDNSRFRFTLRMCAKLGQSKEPSNSAAYDVFVSSIP